MILERLSLINFKNISEANLSFSDKINCFLGNNGMGKTNLLDAIYYLSFCKSCTNIIDSQNIKHGESFFMINGDYTEKDTETEVYCGVKIRQKKIFKKDKKEYERLSTHIGLIPLVLVSPEDNELVKERSETRRKFVDQTLSQFDKRYLTSLMEYNKSVTARNAMLRSGTEEEALFEIIEERMRSSAEEVYRRRMEFVHEFTPVFDRFYREICNGKESVSLLYKSHLSEGNLAELLKGSRRKDTILGYTSVGVHRDDLEMELEGFPIKKFGSQGQTKSFSLSLRLAQFYFLKEKSGKTPLLLLDDIFDKLDSERVGRIMEIVSGNEFGQIFVTDTNREYLDRIVRRAGGDFKLFGVENGIISEVE